MLHSCKDLPGDGAKYSTSGPGMGMGFGMLVERVEFMAKLFDSASRWAGV